MDPDLEFAEDYDQIEDDLIRQCVYEEFESIILFHYATGQFVCEPNPHWFGPQGSVLLIQGER